MREPIARITVTVHLDSKDYAELKALADSRYQPPSRMARFILEQELAKHKEYKAIDKPAWTPEKGNGEEQAVAQVKSVAVVRAEVT